MSEPEERGKGCRRIRLDPHTITGLLNWRMCELLAAPEIAEMPKDIEYLNISYEPAYRSWVIIAESIEWTCIPPGEEIPFLNRNRHMIHAVNLRKGEDGCYGVAEDKGDE